MRNTSSTIEKYFDSLSSGTNPLLQKAREAATGLGLQRISLGDLELGILKTWVLSHGCKSFIEVGTLTGASGLAILGGMPEGAKFWTLEHEQKHADLANPVLQEAARAKNQQCKIVVGDAREKLSEIAGEGPFDGIFIDGNKAAYGDYLAWAEKNVRKGGIIIADNVFLGGAVLGETNDKFSAKQVQVMKEFNQRLMNEDLFASCLIPTSEGMFVGVKLF
jgi:predicted O-methyltransferase YrrM